jgi:hypothetical protein
MAEKVIASFPLTVASYKKCSRFLARGEVKRNPQRGALLIGYVIGCPACGWSAWINHEDCGTQKGAAFVEDPPTEERVSLTVVRRIVSMANPQLCIRCKRHIRVRDGKLEAVEAVA